MARGNRRDDSGVAVRRQLLFPRPASHARICHRTTLPDVCPQPAQDNSGDWTGNEDCLFVVLYVPDSFNGSTLAWIHGGSLLVGGANDPLIDGSALALATQSIVAVVQYRLGVLGFLPPLPGGSTPNDNLGVRDAILALNILHTILPSFGASPTLDVSLGGQSAGAMLIRAILASPSASSLFNRVILHSDVLDYGFFNTSTLTTLQNNFFPMLNCTATDPTCQNALALGDIMEAQMNFNAAQFDGSTAGPIPFRPVHDGSLITSTLTHSFPTTRKPMLVTTANDEGAAMIFSGIPVVLPTPLFGSVLSSLIPDFRAQAVLNSGLYALDSNDSDTVRNQLKQVVTDLAWRCPDWTFAKAWATGGGTVFTGFFERGGLHGSNIDIPFCASETHVCHTDDVPILFGTQPNPTSTQAALIAEVQARWSNFIHFSNPNPSGLPTWTGTTSAAVNTFVLGGSTPVAAGACANFWGTPTAPFDYQIWGL
ncbi:alpha/beta-hydrolase [Auricularia subglabra TFB-10046 SS5]|nr:alpha/beta-hydrolase [Auricularia subglabra TFB-10046 SS5]